MPFNNHTSGRIVPARSEKDGRVEYFWYPIAGVSFFFVMMVVGLFLNGGHILAQLVGILVMIAALVGGVKAWTLAQVNVFKIKSEQYLSASGFRDEVLLAVSFGFFSKDMKWSFVLDKPCGIALTNRRLILFDAQDACVLFENASWQMGNALQVYSIMKPEFDKVSVKRVFMPPGIAIFAKRLVIRPGERTEPISILVFNKFGRNAEVLNTALTGPSFNS